MYADLRSLVREISFAIIKTRALGNSQLKFGRGYQRIQTWKVRDDALSGLLE
jgi:hypothetical protein